MWLRGSGRQLLSVNNPDELTTRLAKTGNGQAGRGTFYPTATVLRESAETARAARYYIQCLLLE